jgi:hypothetical protein
MFGISELYFQVIEPCQIMKPSNSMARSFNLESSVWRGIQEIPRFFCN